MKAACWTRGDLVLAGGAAIGLATTADVAWSLHARFALDLSGLSALERAGAALWDFRPLATAVFAAGAVAVLSVLGEPLGRLTALHGLVRDGLALLAAAHAALALTVVAFAAWVAAAGELGGREELGFVYSSEERVVTLVTQLVAWVPLAVVLGAVALRAGRTRAPEREPAADAAPAPRAEAASPVRPLAAEMEELWRERLAFGPRRERARALLGRIQALEASGDHERARSLAEEMRALEGPP